MTALAEAPASRPMLYHPPVAVPFQARDAALAYLQKSLMAIWDTGIGKSYLTMATVCLALREDAIDTAIIICEQNKLKEWEADFRASTGIDSIGLYYGPKRKAMLDVMPTVVISSYETWRNDAVQFETKTKYTDGPLIGALQGRRVLIAYDEISKLGNRSSRLYKAHYRTMTRLRKLHPGIITLGLTATPHEGGGHERFFNEMRFVCPPAMPTVKEFEDRVISSRDPWGRPHYRPDGVEWFRQRCEPYISRRRKTDPEVRASFPPFAEQFATAQMHADQAGIYRRLEDLAWDKDGNHVEVPGLATLLRQMAGDPMALEYAAQSGSSDMAKMAWRALGKELEECSSAKAELLEERYIGPILASGHKMIIFTFFSNTVLPALHDRIRRPDRSIYLYQGEMTKAAKDRSLEQFRAHRGPAVLLASDSASKGINAPEASYTVEYEPARTHATRMQRAGRAHRAFSDVPLTFITLVAERTVEESRAIPSLMERNEQQDQFFGDDVGEYTTADDRRRMFAMARHRKGA